MAADCIKKLKIGILMRDIEKLENWEYRILKGIIEHPNLELCVFIKDGRKQTKKNLFASNAVTNALFSLQMKVESLVFKRKQTVDAAEIISKTKDTGIIYLNPAREGLWDVFSKEDSGKVKAYDLDIILKHEFCIIRGDILRAARHGIWNLHHADTAINRGDSPAGFWEMTHNEPCSGVTLQLLTEEPESGLVIDKAWYNWFFSFLKTNNDLLENSVTLLFKNINKLLDQGHIDTKKPLTYCHMLHKKPALKDLLAYMIKFYLKAFTYIFNRVLPLKRMNCWTLCFGKGSFLEAELFRMNPVAVPKNEFWADPFLYEYNNQLYVFFETYPYKTRRGKLSSGKVIADGNGKYSVTGVQDILVCDYHLSYPQIVNEDGELFMMPETHQNKRLEVYRCVQFPGKWELYATAFKGEEIIDPTYFYDCNGNRWLLVNKGWTHEAELHIYKIDSLKLGSITPHRQNPVLIDCMRGRNGGGIFKYENEYYRPSQINTHGFYGKGLQISKIKKLTLDEFEDEPIITVEPKFMKGLIGMHHLYHFGDNFVFDTCFKKL